MCYELSDLISEGLGRRDGHTDYSFIYVTAGEIQCPIFLVSILHELMTERWERWERTICMNCEENMTDVSATKEEDISLFLWRQRLGQGYGWSVPKRVEERNNICNLQR